MIEPHVFVGRLDRWCEVCSRPDRDPIHVTDPAVIPQVTPGATLNDPVAPGAHGDESPASTGRTR